MTGTTGLPLRWTRSNNGVLAGVCKGLADAFGIDVVIVRIAWILAFFLAGFGGLLYIGLALAFPRQDRLDQAYDDRLLGVCARLAERTNIEVGVMRLMALVSLCLSMGATALAYIVIYFVLPSGEKNKITV